MTSKLDNLLRSREGQVLDAGKFDTETGERNWVRCIKTESGYSDSSWKLSNVYHKVDRSDKHGPGGGGYTVCGLGLCEEDSHSTSRPRGVSGGRLVRMCLRCRKARK